MKSVPVIGHWLLRVMRGGDEVTIRTLYRFFALHVCILPIATFGLIGTHLLLVQQQGMAAAVPDDASRASRASAAACRSSPTSRCATCCSGSSR